mgnify:CR=1 FL=1
MSSAPLRIGSVTRELPLVQVGPGRRVPLVEFLGDPELTNAAAEAMKELIRPGEADILLTVVTNSLPLVHELSDRSGLPYEVARKTRRSYMTDPLIQEVPGLSLGVGETLWLERRHAEQLHGRRVLIVQGVVSTGNTALALAKLAERAGGEVVGYLSAFYHAGKTLPFELRSLAPLPQ